MVGSTCSVYYKDKRGACSSGVGGVDGGVVIGRRGIVGLGRMEGGRLKQISEKETIRWRSDG